MLRCLTNSNTRVFGSLFPHSSLPHARQTEAQFLKTKHLQDLNSGWAGRCPKARLRPVPTAAPASLHQHCGMWHRSMLSKWLLRTGKTSVLFSSVLMYSWLHNLGSPEQSKDWCPLLKKVGGSNTKGLHVGPVFCGLSHYLSVYFATNSHSKKQCGLELSGRRELCIFPSWSTRKTAKAVCTGKHLA